MGCCSISERVYNNMSESSFDDMFEDDSDSEVSLNYEEELQKVKENDPNTTKLYVEGEDIGYVRYLSYTSFSL